MVLSPRVNISVQNNITLTTPGGPGVVAVIGTAQWGSKTALQIFDSFAQLLSYYQEDKSGLDQGIIRAADILYANGATTVKVIRIVDGTDVAANVALAGNSGGESGVLTFSGLSTGTYGNNILVTVTTQGTGRILTITDGANTEYYTNSSATNGYATNQAIANAINGISTLVNVAVKAGSETTNLVDAVSNAALTSGLDGASAITQSHYTTAFDTFLANEDWDILVCPGTDALNALDSFHTAILGKMTLRANTNKKYGVFVSGVILNELLAGMQARTTAGSRLTLCAPSMVYTPRYQTATVNLNGTWIACAVAGYMAGNNVQVSPTRKVVSIDPIVNTSTGKKYYTPSDIEQILQQRIMPISLIEGGTKVARGVTRIADTTSIYYEINIVRIIDYVMAQVQNILDPFLGESNLERVRNTMAKTVDGVLQQDIRDEVIVAYKPTEVTVGISPDTANVSMTIQPTFAVNFINVVLAVSRL